MTIEACRLCPRDCKVQRYPDQGEGFCGAGTMPKVARAALHHWEEPCISGTRGSGTVFFTGCTLKCVYCQNAVISQSNDGVPVTPIELAAIYDNLAIQGAHNINMVNPTHYLPAIRHSLQLWKHQLPVVYNTSGYESISVIPALKDIVDVYLPDLKYANASVAAKYSAAPDYFEKATAAILAMVKQAGDLTYDAQGLLVKGVIVRHLVLPGHIAQSREVLDWIAANLKGAVLVSLMCQYVPCGRAGEYPRINRRLSRDEYQRVLDHLYALGLEDGYVQEPTAASMQFIPDFNGIGVGGKI